MSSDREQVCESEHKLQLVESNDRTQQSKPHRIGQSEHIWIARCD